MYAKHQTLIPTFIPKQCACLWQGRRYEEKWGGGGEESPPPPPPPLSPPPLPTHDLFTYMRTAFIDCQADIHTYTHTYTHTHTHTHAHTHAHTCTHTHTWPIDMCDTHIHTRDPFTRDAYETWHIRCEMSHTWTSHVTHMNESCHTYERVMSHIWTSHVTHMNESCHTYERVMSHKWMRRVTYEWVTWYMTAAGHAGEDV